MKTVFASLLLAMTLPVAAQSQPASGSHDAHHTTAAPAATALSEGQVRKVDTDAKKITLRHGPLDNLGMPPMTMVFQVSDPAFLDKVKTGDKVRFRAEQVNGVYTVTRIESAN